MAGSNPTSYDKSGVHTEDAAHVSGDSGVLILGVRQDAPAAFGADGDNTPFQMSEHGCANVDAQHFFEISPCNALVEKGGTWSVGDTDTTGLAVTVNHVYGTKAIEFDRVDGAANTKIGAVGKVVTSFSADVFMEEGGGFLLWSMYISTVPSDLDYVFIRLGTSITHCNEWRIDAALLADGWNSLRARLMAPTAINGNGWNSAVITYVSVGVAMDNIDDVLANVAVDAIFLNSGFHTSSDITSEVSATVNTANINVHRMGGTPVNTGAGAVASATQRVTLGSNDPLVVAGSVTTGGKATITNGTADADTSGAAQACKWAIIQANPDNVGRVWVAVGAAATDGGCLCFPPGSNEKLKLSIGNTNLIHALFKTINDDLYVTWGA